MIGADEKCLSDRYGNTVTVRRTQAGHDQVKALLISGGFKVVGDMVHADKREVEAFFAKAYAL